MDWLDRAIDARINDRLQCSLEKFEQDFIRELRRDRVNSIAVVNDTIRLQKDQTYTLLETETGRPEIIDGWLDLDGMAEGDLIYIEMSIRLPEGDFKRWGKTEIKGIDKNADRDPAFRIEHLLAPAGVKIDVTHKAGRNYEISWYLTRNL